MGQRPRVRGHEELLTIPEARTTSAWQPPDREPEVEGPPGEWEETGPKYV